MLNVSSGEISETSSGVLKISSPNPRAVTRTGSPQHAVLRFRYLGPSEKTRRLASGLLRRQIGLKLEAEDSCNLIYIMYRISPSPALSVQLKHNPGMHSHSQCGNKGYSSLLEKTLPAINDNSLHEIAFERDGELLNITVDGAVKASLVLPPEALELHGAIGLRSDNGNFEVELFAGTLPDIN